MFDALDNHPAWHRGARSRLLVSTAIAAAAVAAFLLLVEFADDPAPRDELEVFLTQPDPVVPPEPVVEEPAPVIEEAVIEDLVVQELPAPAAEPDDVEANPPDWYAEMDQVVEAVVAEGQRAWSVNPVFDEKRRQAAVKFPASSAPVRKPIWENVETDQLGRKILVHGNCHRVIDDPSAVNYEIFRTFTQYFVFCSHSEPPPKDLPWVEEVRERYAYLRSGDPDNDVRTELMADLK